MSRQIHSTSVAANIPFSWENKPGIRKSTADDDDDNDQLETGAAPTGLIMNLPPPPCPPEKRVARASNFHGHQLPPAPAMKAKKGVKKINELHEEDPFLVAYMECTKSDDQPIKAKGMFGLGKKKNNNNNYNVNKINIFSCKKSCSVSDDSIVRMSTQLLPVSRSRRSGVI